MTRLKSWKSEILLIFSENHQNHKNGTLKSAIFEWLAPKGQLKMPDFGVSLTIFGQKWPKMVIF